MTHGQPYWQGVLLTQPNAVTVDDYPTGDIRNNAAIVPAGTPNGGISVITNGATDLVIDINGYYTPPTDLNYNTASGYLALGNNTTGNNNTASGYQALGSNTTGSGNTASGLNALASNNGSANTASGLNALYSNTTGNDNTAIGYEALSSDTGGNNTAIGYQALANSTIGHDNIAVGYVAGDNISTGSHNIDIGNQGSSSDGTAVNSGVIRIGNSLQTSFFAAGISGVGVSGTAVQVDSNGQLGVILSSRRYKEDIQDMDDASSGLLRLRPVTYRYRQPYADGSKPIDYGLIAEEVADVYPDLVVKGADGQIQTVQYHKLTPMLLNEVQKEHGTTQSLLDKVALLEAQVSALQKALEILMSK